MQDKCFILFILITFIRNAVLEISLDYYFGFEDALRTANYMENCNSAEGKESCQEHCGTNHACMLGKCFCVEVKPQIRQNERRKSLITRFNLLNSLRSYKFLEEILRKPNYDAVRRQEPLYDERSSETKSEERGHYYMKLDQMALRPTLRHHIAHFCPNLRIARQCVGKCLRRGKPAFCGKDHVCYCGKKYGTPNDDTYKGSVEIYGQFHDLYERYFGPTTRPGKRKTTTTTTTTSSTTTESVTIPNSSNELENLVNSDNPNEEVVTEGPYEINSDENLDNHDDSGQETDQAADRDNNTTEDQTADQDNNSTEDEAADQDDSPDDDDASENSGDDTTVNPGDVTTIDNTDEIKTEGQFDTTTEVDPNTEETATIESAKLRF